MLAGRLIRAAKDILDEYSRFKISERLQSASNISASRANTQDARYVPQVQELRQWAQSVIDQTKIEKYPSDLLAFLKKSKYATALPAHVARIVISGFPDEKSLAISSSELGIYIQQVDTLRAELGALVAAGRGLDLEEISIPKDEISFDLIIPRNVFHDQANEFDDTLSRFIEIMSLLIELTTGSRGSPTLTYCSASVIVVGLALKAGATAWAFLKLYKLFLEVVEKHLSIIKAIKDLRATPLEDKGEIALEKQMPEILQRLIDDAVTQAAKSMESKVPKDRVNEIKVALGKNGRACVQAIADGARIGVTIESLDEIPLMTEAVPEATPEKIDEIIKQQKILERRIDDVVALLGGSPVLLPPSTEKDKQE